LPGEITLEKPQIVILGAGLAGLGAAAELKNVDCVIYEKNPYYGGHAHSWNYDGFVFDEGPHVSFTKNEEIRLLFANSVRGRYHEFTPRISNYFYGHRIKHPPQCHLFGLPIDLVTQCIVDFVKANDGAHPKGSNYEDWCLSHLGKAFSENFTFKYTRKYWTLDPFQMGTDWVGNRVYRPTFEEVLKGALQDNEELQHYFQVCRYPEEGGFWGYTHLLAEGCPIRYGYEIKEIDVAHKKLIFSDQAPEYYDSLISSLPLPELIPMMKDVPDKVLEASTRLNCTSMVLLNIGVRREDISKDYWLYVYDEDIVFSRVNFPSRLAPKNAPPGTSSVQAEIHYSRYRPLQMNHCLEKGIEDFKKMGILRRDDKILLAEEERIKYGNVIFDLERQKNLKIVLDFLTEKGIKTCGRYGDWGYYWTDDSILSGRRAAREVIKELEAHGRTTT
jgi:protoporphyrinogen oxidase